MNTTTSRLNDKNQYRFIIYKTTNLINNSIYLGRHKTKNISDGYLGSGTLLRKAIKKYGRKNFEREIVEHCLSYDHMIERELHWIKTLNAIKNGYNILQSSTGGDTFTNNPNKETIREKIRNTLIQKQPWLGKHHSEESKKKSSIAMSGINNPNYGKKYTIEERRKFGSPGKKHPMYGKHLSEKTKRKIGEKSKGRNLGKPSPKKGKPISTDDLQKRIGKNNHMFGKHHSKETKELMRQAQLNQTLLTCPHCGYQNNNHGNMIKSHFENCKQKIYK